jgi:hypothetical protein
MLTIDDLQVVVIEDLKDFWNDKDIRQLYCDTIDIKLQGYGNVYGHNVISSDKIDYFGTHLIVCQKGIRLKPLFSYKSVTLDKCEEYKTAFPCISLVEADGSKECLSELSNILNESKKSNNKISFDYSWAQDPNIKSLRTPEMKLLFQDLIMLLVVKHHEDHGINEMITCGSVKVKTDQFFQKMGFDPISSNSIFPQSSLNGDLAQIFHTKVFSKYALDISKKYEALWDARISYSSQNIQVLKKAA